MRHLSHHFILIASLMSSLAHGQNRDTSVAAHNNASTILNQWAAKAALTPNFSIKWEVLNQIVERDAGVREEFATVEDYIYRWPDCMIAQARVKLSDEYVADPRRSIRFNWDRSINVHGKQIFKAPGAGTFHEMSPADSLADILKTEAINAPSLLGLWLHDSAQNIKTESVEDGHIRAWLPMGGLVITLARFESNITSDIWGIDSIEVHDDEGVLVAGWKYEKLFVPKGFYIATGQVRIPYSPRSLNRSEGPPSKLVRIETIAKPTDSIFDLDLQNAVTINPSSGKILDNHGKIVGQTKPSFPNTLRMYWPVVLGGSGGFVILVVGIYVMKNAVKNRA